MRKSKLASRITTVVWNTFARKANDNIPYCSAVNLEKAIGEGIKEHIYTEIANIAIPKKKTYEIMFLYIPHNQFKVKSFDNAALAIEWLRYMERKKDKCSWFKHIACNFQDEYDACNEVPF